MSKKAYTHVTEHDDGKFVRTALIVAPNSRDGEGGSVDIVDHDGNRLGQVNIFTYEDGHLIVDVIDVDDRYGARVAVTLPDGKRLRTPAGKVVSADFRDVK